MKKVSIIFFIALILIMSFYVNGLTPFEKCDVNKDKIIDIIDITAITNNFGTNNSIYDINGDRIVNTVDRDFCNNFLGQKVEGSPFPTQCNDTDGGSSPYIWGVVTGLNLVGQRITNMDSCNSNGTILYEAICRNNVSGVDYPVVGTNDIFCPDGCKDGICINSIIKETVKCVFNNSNTVQKCSSEKGSCNGTDSCIVEISGLKGENVTWKSTCGGYSYTQINGTNKYARFECKPSLVCTDSDNGKNPYAYGEVTGPNVQGQLITTKDQCAQKISSSQDKIVESCAPGANCKLYERVCINDPYSAKYPVVGTNDIPCPNGCKGGVCTSYIALTVSQTSSKIYIDGVYFATTSYLPGIPIKVTGLLPGNHELKITKEGYVDYITTQYIDIDQVLSLKISLNKKPTLRIETSPAGASIYLNDVYKGQSPVYLVLDPLSYNLRINKTEYYEYYNLVGLYEDQNVLIRTDLMKIRDSSITIYSNPLNAELFLNGESKGKINTSLGLTVKGFYPSRNVIKLVKAGYRDYTDEFYANPHSNFNLNVKLTPSMPFLQCFDSEQMLDSSTAGSVFGTDILGNNFTYQDRCEYDSNVGKMLLTETYCAFNEPKEYKGIFCDGECKDGKCVEQIQECTDSDGGENYFVKGNVQLGNTINTDYCQENNAQPIEVVEWYCRTPTEIDNVWFKCPNGCKDGACLNSSLVPPLILAVDDQSPTSDVVLLVDVVTKLKEKGYQDISNTATLFSQVNTSSLDKKVTLAIYKGEAKVIVGTTSPTDHVVFANILMDILRGFNITPNLMISGDVHVSNLKELFVKLNCIDSDGGANYLEKGTVVSSQGNKTDYCLGTDLVLEYYCANDTLRNTTYNCTYMNHVCAGGRCFNNTPICNELVSNMSMKTDGEDATFEFRNIDGNIVEIPYYKYPSMVALGAGYDEFLLIPGESLQQRANYANANISEVEGTMLLYTDSKRKAHILEISNLDMLNYRITIDD
jgi:hypothetical protein